MLSSLAAVLLLRLVHAAHLTQTAALSFARRLMLHLAHADVIPPKVPVHVGVVIGGFLVTAG